MLLLAGVDSTPALARARLEAALASGAAARKFQEVIDAQGGNPSVVDDPAALPQATECELFVAPRSGVVVRVRTAADWTRRDGVGGRAGQAG